MTLNLPNRFVWLLIGAIILFLLQSGCQPIQPPRVTPTDVANQEGARADLSTSITTESQSPDGNWIATSLFQIPRASESYFQSLIVSHATGTPSYTLIDGEFELALGYTVTVPLTWSTDSARFYYSNRPQADGCGLFFNGSDLYVLDLTTGDSIELLPAETTTTLALAPNEQHVAFLAMHAAALIIHDLASETTTSFDLAPLLDEAQVGSFIWAPDSSSLAFAVAHSPCVGGWAAASSIYVLDIATMVVTPQLIEDDRLLSPMAWPTANALILENRDGEPFTLDPTSGTITQ